MNITPGKRAGLEAVSRNGVIAAMAVDHRGPLFQSIAKARGVDPSTITGETLGEFKTAVTRILSPYTSGFLLDPEYGLGAAKSRDKNCGLLLAYERLPFDPATRQRFPVLLPTWSVRKLKEAGAQGIKILVHYTPHEDAQANEQKHVWVERIGAECAVEDIPLFLEPIAYDPGGLDQNGPEFARIKPEVVIASIEEFSKPRYRADVLKVEFPINVKYVEGTRAFEGPAAQTRPQALDLFRRAAAATKQPFIYLSAGVTNEEYTECLEMAAEAGVKFNGVLCGRAIWQKGLPLYATQGLHALEDFLNTEGVQNMKAINQCLGAATPWN